MKVKVSWKTTRTEGLSELPPAVGYIYHDVDHQIEVNEVVQHFRSMNMRYFDPASVEIKQLTDLEVNELLKRRQVFHPFSFSEPSVSAL